MTSTFMMKRRSQLVDTRIESVVFLRCYYVDGNYELFILNKPLIKSELW
jgi:hypothetical protein